LINYYNVQYLFNLERMWLVSFVLLYNRSWMLFVTSTFHSVVFPLWLIMVLCCCGLLFAVCCLLLSTLSITLNGVIKHYITLLETSRVKMCCNLSMRTKMKRMVSLIVVSRESGVSKLNLPPTSAIFLLCSLLGPEDGGYLRTTRYRNPE
jgi:hypothetical protein